jgi:hypothetical protein
MNKPHLITIPGNGSSNKIWAEKARDYFFNDFMSLSVQYYDHWSNGGELIDMRVELNKLADTANSLDGNIIILAKSIGTTLFMFSIYSKSINPSRISRCVFVGLPPEWARTNGFDIDGWSTAFTIPTTLIQNDNDPVATAEDIRKEQVGAKFKNITLIEVKGDNHVYGDFDKIGNYLLM